MAYPKKKLKPRHYPIIEQLAAEGISEKMIARRVGMGADAFRRIKREDQKCADALDAGREAEHTVLRNVLVDAAKGGNVVAAMFLLKCRHGYREQAPLPTENRVTVEMRLPAPLKPADYGQVIEHEPIKLTHHEET